MIKRVPGRATDNGGKLRDQPKKTKRYNLLFIGLILLYYLLHLLFVRVHRAILLAISIIWISKNFSLLTLEGKPRI